MPWNVIDWLCRRVLFILINGKAILLGNVLVLIFTSSSSRFICKEKKRSFISTKTLLKVKSLSFFLFSLQKNFHISYSNFRPHIKVVCFVFYFHTSCIILNTVMSLCGVYKINFWFMGGRYHFSLNSISVRVNQCRMKMGLLLTGVGDKVFSHVHNLQDKGQFKLICSILIFLCNIYFFFPCYVTTISLVFIKLSLVLHAKKTLFCFIIAWLPFIFPLMFSDCLSF